METPCFLLDGTFACVFMCACDILIIDDSMEQSISATRYTMVAQRSVEV